MPTTSETQDRIRTVTRQKELWDKGIATSLEHERGITEKDGVLYYDNRVYVPRHTVLQGEIITQSHDHITAGHLGIAKTQELVLCEYWWPKMKKDVEAYIAGCETCQRTKTSTQEVEKYLKIFINHRQDDWADWLLLAEFTHNNRTHSATGKSLFMVMYGRNPRILPDSPCLTDTQVPAAIEFSNTMAKIHKETKAARRMKKQYDKSRCNAKDYNIGDLVWLDATNLHLPRPKKKLDDKHVSPFKMLEKTGVSAYKLKLPPHWKIHSNSHHPPPPPDLINGEEQWEIKEILDLKTCKVQGKRGQPSKTVNNYFIKWKGWTQEHNSWVTEIEMGNAQEAIEEYEAQQASWMDIAKIATPSSRALAMILDHDYKDNSDVFYLAQ
ncbi:uncharacterized protein ARMOST_04670 [Armillaria ostoyae]|uniref:Chromo domain-containing protein n=1 Tax=Armillaria ostoyae TaxID=47428 RepID=A0A284QY02_ARMOS|nr:uncharacterized protein ARMOST_04670 [Armillaria ostoyae]